MAGFFVIFVINDKKLSSKIAQISEHINYTKNHSCDQMSKMIINLGSKKGDNNDNSPTQISAYIIHY